ncbi:hypothetical protein ACLB2K_040054 [Fragaria x ananassa]
MVLPSTGVAVCGSFRFGICMGYSAPSQSAIRKDLRLSITEYSMFGSILSIGAVLGAFTSGKIAETLGRKGGAILLDIGRLLTGYGISLFSYVVPVFIAEIAPKNLGGGLATLNQAKVGREEEFEIALQRLHDFQAVLEPQLMRVFSFDTQSQVSIVRIVHLVSVI